jgi:hypothetical protein
MLSSSVLNLDSPANQMVGWLVPMSVWKTARLALATCVLLAAGATAASAEIVVMTSGATLSVKGHTTDGDLVVLSLRSGGDVTCNKSLIERIVPDEVPHPDPAPPAAQTGQAPAPQERGALLKDTIYTELIAAAAEAHGVDPLLVQALLQVESNYQPRAIST